MEKPCRYGGKSDSIGGRVVAEPCAPPPPVYVAVETANAGITLVKRVKIATFGYGRL
jgi:hypothetical protein